MSRSWQDWLRENPVPFAAGFFIGIIAMIGVDKFSTGITESRLKLAQEQLDTLKEAHEKLKITQAGVVAQLKEADSRQTESGHRLTTLQDDLAKLRAENTRITAAAQKSAQDVDRLTRENDKLKRAVPPRVVEPKKPIELNETDKKVLARLFRVEHAGVSELTAPERFATSDLPVGAVQNSLDRLKDHGLAHAGTCVQYQQGKLTDITTTCWMMTKFGRTFAEQSQARH